MFLPCNDPSDDAIVLRTSAPIVEEVVRCAVFASKADAGAFA
jgi:hypothetical protein